MKIAKTGWYLYDGQVRVPVRIIETEHQPIAAIERGLTGMGPWFEVEIRAGGSRTDGFASIDEAIAYCESYDIEWDAP